VVEAKVIEAKAEVVKVEAKIVREHQRQLLDLIID